MCTSFQLTIYKVSNLEIKLMHWENSDEFVIYICKKRDVVSKQENSNTKQYLQRFKNNAIFLSYQSGCLYTKM